MKHIIEYENLIWYINNVPDFIKDFKKLEIEDNLENRIDFMIYHRNLERYNIMKYRCGEVV